MWIAEAMPSKPQSSLLYLLCSGSGIKPPPLIHSVPSEEAIVYAHVPTCWIGKKDPSLTARALPDKRDDFKSEVESDTSKCLENQSICGGRRGICQNQLC